MTTPFNNATWPSSPTMPSTAPAGYVTPTAPNPSTSEPPKTPAEINTLRGQFWELLLQKVVEALAGAFIPGAGSAFTQLQAWVQNIPFVGDILSLFNWLVTGQGTPPTNIGGFPYTFPFAFVAGDAQRFFTNLRAFFTHVNFLDPNFNPLAAVQDFISLVLLPQNLLASVANLNELAANILAGFQSIPGIGSLFGVVRDVINALFNAGTSNAAQIADLRSRIEVPPAGVQWTEEFNGAADGPISTDFTVTYSGAGSGIVELDGAGRMRWQQGSGNRTAQVINTAHPLATNTQYVAVVIDGRNDGASAGNAVTHFINARSNSTGSTCVRVAVIAGTTTVVPTIRVEAVNSGTVTQIGADYTGGWTNGDLFEFFVGNGGTDRHYIVKKQGVTILDVTESGSVSTLGNLNAGCGMKAGLDIFGFQMVPASISSVTASDRT